MRDEGDNDIISITSVSIEEQNMARVEHGQTRRRFAVDEIGKPCSAFSSHRRDGDQNSLLSCGNNATVRERVINTL